MREHRPADALARYLDALVTGDGEAPPDSDTELVARRYVELGQAPAPAGARERVRGRVAQQAGQRRNGHQATGEPLARLVVLAPERQPTAPDVWRPPSSYTPGADHRVTAHPRRSWPAFIVVLALVATGFWLLTHRSTQQGVIRPGAEPVLVTPAPTLPADGALLEIDLPAGSLPVAAYGITFDQRTMPAHQESTESSAGPLLFRYIVSGQAEVQSDAALQVWKAGGAGGWSTVAAHTPVALGAGDAIFLRDAATVLWSNRAADPVTMIAWAMIDQGAGNSAVPAGWTLHQNAALHMAVFDEPDLPVTFALRRIELAPGEKIAPLPGSTLSHFVALDRNDAGEQVAPMFGKLPAGARRNLGQQALTIYQYNLMPTGSSTVPVAPAP